MNIFPAPKTLKKLEGFVDISGGVKITGYKNTNINAKLQAVLAKNNVALFEQGYCISLQKTARLKPQHYKIFVEQAQTRILFGDVLGAFYGVLTLGQILAAAPRLPLLEIEDFPDFLDRGLMLDISRNKVPKLKTLFELVDFLSEIKINQLQLYIEGTSFFYESFKTVYKKGTDFLTASDIKRLDRYCKKNFVELVPNQNSFGHFSEWLSKPEFADLAEIKTKNPQYKTLPSTLNPLKKESVDFVAALTADLLPNFSSQKFNIGGDEPYDLGMGASRLECEKKGKGAVYFEYMSKIFDIARQYGKQIMMWGDIIKNYPDYIKKLPNDVIALEWGYCADSFNDEVCSLYQDNGVCYYVCPGTALWNTVAGRSDYMLENIKGAARSGFRKGAAGFLNTDWGDGGTCQQLALAYFPYAVGAAYSWNSQVEQESLAFDYLDKGIYSKLGAGAARLVYELGNYYKSQNKLDDNATKIFKMLYMQQTDNLNFGTNFEPLFNVRDTQLISKEEYFDTKVYLENVLERINKLVPCDEQGALQKEEMTWAAQYLIHGCQLGLFVCDDDYRNPKTLFALEKDIRYLLSKYKQIWKIRNKKSGLELSILRMKALLNKYDALIKSIN